MAVAIHASADAIRTETRAAGRPKDIERIAELELLRQERQTSD